MPAEPVSITPMAAWSLQEAALSRCKGVLVRRKTQRFCILQPLHIRQRHILQTFMGSGVGPQCDISKEGSYYPDELSKTTDFLHF
jgi:hypothetical protein